MLSNRQYLDLSGNKLSRLIPEEVRECFKLQHLSLSSNNLNGSILSQISKLVNLNDMLDLGKNSLTGEIPPQIGDLLVLQVLNLSHNELSGRVPSSLINMISLTLIDLSYSLCGTEWFSHNKGLCGTVHGLPSCDTSPTSQTRTTKGFKFVIIIVPILSALLISFFLVGATLLFCKRGKHVGHEPILEVNQSTFSVWNFNGKIAYGDIITATENFSDDYCIGSGAYGKVYRATLPTQETVAVKRLQPLEEESSKTQTTSGMK